jgi:galacturonosyltransferase
MPPGWRIYKQICSYGLYVYLGIPYVVNITGLGNAIENGGLLQKVTVELYKFGLRKAKKVFFQNTENRDFMLGHGVIKGSYDLRP